MSRQFLDMEHLYTQLLPSVLPSLHSNGLFFRSSVPTTFQPAAWFACEDLFDHYFLWQPIQRADLFPSHTRCLANLQTPFPTSLLPSFSDLTYSLFNAYLVISIFSLSNYLPTYLPILLAQLYTWTYLSSHLSTLLTKCLLSDTHLLTFLPTFLYSLPNTLHIFSPSYLPAFLPILLLTNT